MVLLAVRLIDLAIFGSLGGLWLGGVLFIVVLYRWILRYERAGAGAGVIANADAGVTGDAPEVLTPDRAVTRPERRVPAGPTARPLTANP